MSLTIRSRYIRGQKKLYAIDLPYISVYLSHLVLGVPNDAFAENPPHSVFNITRVSLRQSCLIFNFPGKKIPALHRQQAGF